MDKYVSRFKQEVIEQYSSFLKHGLQDVSA